MQSKLLKKRMSNSKAIAIGSALFVGFLVHFFIASLYLFNIKKPNKNHQKERASKMYLFGAAAILSMRFECIFSAIFSWFTLAALVFYHVPVFISNENTQKKMHNLSYFIFNTFISAWWIGEVIYIYAIF